MKQRKMRILIFSLDDPRHSQPQLRLLGPVSYLPKNEFGVIWAPSLKALISLPILPDVVVFHRNYYRLNEIKKIINFCKKRGIPTIMEFDDYVLNVPQEYASHCYYEAIKDDLIEIFSKVDMMIVTTKRLKEAYSIYNSNIYILPNLLDPKLWYREFTYNSMGDQKIVIGYAGAPAHAYDFEVVLPALDYILSKYGEKIALKFIGYQPKRFKNLPNFNHIPTIRAYRKYADVLMNSGFTFVIAPLKKDSVTICKSNIKYLEYSACGYPGIYSDVGPYSDTIRNKITGLVVKNTTENWIEAFETMIENADLRKNIALNAYNDVWKNYSMGTRAGEWAELFRRAVRGKKKSLHVSVSPLFSYGPYMMYAEIRNMLKHAIIPRKLGEID